MLETGQNLRQYRIERFLGKGGMGEVYLAFDTKLLRKVALKVLPSALAADHERKKKFIREAIAVSRLNHPNICVVFDADETPEGVAYISMEYIEGETLASHIARGRLPLELVRAYGVQIADALEEAHRRGVIHRDLKPANVMIDRHGRVKILDFGLARLLQTESEPANSAALTMSAESGTIAGTPLYMSPEQTRGERLDPRSDIFSFGVLLYELITGNNPFSAPSAAAVFSRVLTETPSPVRQVRSDVAPDLERILCKAMEKDRNLRYSSAREIAIDLRRLDGQSVDESRSRTDRASSWSRTATAVAVAAAALAIVLVYFGARGTSPSTEAIDSLAVLPLRDLSPKPGGDYLADGMTEALISGLAQIRSLKVISRTSAMQYKNTKKSLPQIARELGVDAVIEGSIAQDSDQIRVSAQLIDARTDRHLWAQSYDREMRDVLRLQGEIARTIADALRVELLPAEKARLSHSRQIDPLAHDLYVRARYEWSKRGRSLFKSIDLLNQALALEPAWPLAHAALGDSYNLLANNGYVSRDEGYTKGKAAARRALELDPDLGQAHTALAFALWHHDLNWDAAGRGFRKAIELEPSYAPAHHFFAMYLTAIGKDSEALAEIRKALVLDPLSPRINTNYGDILRCVGQEAEAIAQLERHRATDPGQALRGLVFAYVRQKKSPEAMKAAEEAAAINPSVARDLQALVLASRSGKAALPLIHELDAEQIDGFHQSKGVALTAAYLVAGDHERAWKAFERIQQYSSMFVLREPLLEPLRNDARYPAFLAKLKLPSPVVTDRKLSGR